MIIFEKILLMNNFIANKIISGKTDKNFLLKRLINFNLDYIIPIMYNHAKNDKQFDKIAEIETELSFLS